MMNGLGVRVSSWLFYDQAARQGEYGDIVSAQGRLALTKDYEVMADFFAGYLRSREAVIDVGCGLGFPSLTLVPHVLHITAVDAAPAMVARLNEHVTQLGYHGRMSIVLADAAALPFHNASFDGAVISGTLGSLAHPDVYLRELHRILQPGSVVACVTQNFAYKLQADQGKPGRWFRMEQGRLSLQVIEYLQHPYRIHDWRYEIRQDSVLYRSAAEQHPDESFWRAVVEQAPSDLRRNDVVAAQYDESIQFDLATLREAFAEAGYHEIHHDLRQMLGNELIFTVVQCR